MPDEKAADKKVKETTVKSQHHVTIGGQEVRYWATAGTMFLKEEDGTEKAAIYYTAYTRQGVDDLSQRPITFAFNGGPGSSSVWLHLGCLGPRRVQLERDGQPLPPPGELVDNDCSILDQTDLVFIDPVSTGFSRAVPGQEEHDYHKFESDITSVAEFIQRYTSRNKRWHSPKYLAGESYGTTRAAGLAKHLQMRDGIYLNGIVLISAVLHFQSICFDYGNDLPFVLFLPSYAATAWHHGCLDPEIGGLAEVLARAEAFCRGPYTQALFEGSALDSERRQAVVEELANLTGLSHEYIERTDLRINIHRFTKELLRGRQQTIGRFDSRIMGRDRDDAGELYEYDPSYANVQGAYTAALNQYLRAELAFASELPYEILTGRVQPWNYQKFQNQYVDVTEGLRQAMMQNPSLRLLIANGYYDLATPYFATEYTVNHMGLPVQEAHRLRMTYYPAGHMMYTDPDSLLKLKSDLDAFFGG